MRRQIPAEIAYIDVDGIFGDFCILPPHFIQYLPSRDDLSRLSRKAMQQVELTATEREQRFTHARRSAAQPEAHLDEDAHRRWHN